MPIDRDRFDAIRILLDGLLRQARSAANSDLDRLLLQAYLNLGQAQDLIESYGLFMKVPPGYVPPTIPPKASASAGSFSTSGLRSSRDIDASYKLED